MSINIIQYCIEQLEKCKATENSKWIGFWQSSQVSLWETRLADAIQNFYRMPVNYQTWAIQRAYGDPRSFRNRIAIR